MSFDNFSTDGAECPHCHHLHKPENDNYSLCSESTDTWLCEDCGTDFAVDVHITHSWTTEKLESPS